MGNANARPLDALQMRDTKNSSFSVDSDYATSEASTCVESAFSQYKPVVIMKKKKRSPYTAFLPRDQRDLCACNSEGSCTCAVNQVAKNEVPVPNWEDMMDELTELEKAWKQDGEIDSITTTRNRLGASKKQAEKASTKKPVFRNGNVPVVNGYVRSATQRSLIADMANHKIGLPSDSPPNGQTKVPYKFLSNEEKTYCNGQSTIGELNQTSRTNRVTKLVVNGVSERGSIWELRKMRMRKNQKNCQPHGDSEWMNHFSNSGSDSRCSSSPTTETTNLHGNNVQKTHRHTNGHGFHSLDEADSDSAGEWSLVNNTPMFQDGTAPTHVHKNVLNAQLNNCVAQSSANLGSDLCDSSDMKLGLMVQAEFHRENGRLPANFNNESLPSLTNKPALSPDMFLWEYGDSDSEDEGRPPDMWPDGNHENSYDRTAPFHYAKRLNGCNEIAGNDCSHHNGVRDKAINNAQLQNGCKFDEYGHMPLGFVPKSVTSFDMPNHLVSVSDYSKAGLSASYHSTCGYKTPSIGPKQSSSMSVSTSSLTVSTESMTSPNGDDWSLPSYKRDHTFGAQMTVPQSQRCFSDDNDESKVNGFSENVSPRSKSMRARRARAEKLRPSRRQRDARSSRSSRSSSLHRMDSTSSSDESSSSETPLNLSKSQPSITDWYRKNFTRKSSRTSGNHNMCSSFATLIDVVLLKILSHLTTDDLCVCSRVCKHWYNAVWHPNLWSNIVIRNHSYNLDLALKMITAKLDQSTPSICLPTNKIILTKCEKMTDNGLAVIASRCPELRHLEIIGCPNITNNAVFKLVGKCKLLEHLNLTGCSSVSNLSSSENGRAHKDFAQISSSKQINLRYLDMTDCLQLDDEGVKTIASHCENLRHLYLRRCANVSDVGVQHIANHCKQLKEISICDCTNATDVSLQELSRLGQQLRYLSAAKCEKISDKGIVLIAQNCTKLRYLNVRGCEAVTNESLTALAQNCPRLRSVDIGKCSISDSGVELLAQSCTKLKKLSLKACTQITEKGLILLAYHARGLQQLNVQECELSSEAYRTIKRFCKKCLIEHTNLGLH